MKALRPLARPLLPATVLLLTFAVSCNEKTSSPAVITPVPPLAVTASPTPNPVPTLHAWANPISAGGVRIADHTWVTTYDAASQCPPAQTYWFSWGSCHGIGPGSTAKPLGEHAADVAVAKCICEPDVENYEPTPDNPYHGGIDYYGVTGVCHQLSNRILWATTRGAGDPTTVDGAMGYGVSRWVYGTYGTNVSDWQARIARCAAAGSPVPPSPAPGTPVAMAMRMAAAPRSLDADLDAMIREKLGPEFPPAKAAKIREIRARLLAKKALLDRTVRIGRIPPARYASSVNDLVDQHLREAAEVLTPEEYEKLFNAPRGEKIGVMDPAIAERSRYRPG